LLRHVRPSEAVYFVHSFAARPSDPRHCIAACVYGGHAIPAVIARENVVGCQFHPEKSGEVGLNVLRGFLAL
jgi:imidazole glycerol-phosphate synthase subunit HisH